MSLGALWLVSGCWAASGATLEALVTDLPQITEVKVIPGHPQLVVLTKTGGVHRVDVATGKASPWFEVPVRSSSEMGLLGIAFAPDFATSGALYLSTNPADGERRSEVRRFITDPGALTSPKPGSEVLTLSQPYGNHDGGQIHFGPDGMLYVAFGDGGSANDPLGAGQDRATWLGTLLRIDVSDPAVPYRVPPDNPLVGTEGAKPEIWAWGLRNPWRFLLLPDGRAIIGDVGQNEVEEVTIGGAGANHGWKMWEGDRCFAAPCSREGMTMPVHTYTHAVGQSITGGVIPTAGPYAGRYLFGDFTTGKLWSLDLASGDVASLGDHDITPSTFGLLPDGSPVVADFQGTLYRLR